MWVGWSSSVSVSVVVGGIGGETSSITEPFMDFVEFRRLCANGVLSY